MGAAVERRPHTLPVTPRPTGPRTIAAGLLALVLVATACGTRVDDATYEAALAAEAAGTTAGGSADGTGTAVDPGASASAPGTGRAPVPVGSTTRGDDTSSTSFGTTAPTTTGDSAAPAGGAGARADQTGVADDAREPTSPSAPDEAPPPSSGDDAHPRVAALSDEVVGDEVLIGLHVPITGAAPMPTDWTKYLDVIQEYINTELPLHGRSIRLIVEDDGYDPSQAMAACRRLADADPLFVIGHTMPAAQDACAGFYDGRDIPYLMRGTTPKVLEGRPLAFFGTAPDDLQGRLLADYVVSHLGGADVPIGVLYQNDQVAAKDHFVSRLAEHGVEVAIVQEGTPKQSDYSATVQKLREAGAELVFISAPPVDAIKLSVQANSQGYHPTWLGGGSYWNYNMVLESAGPALDGAVSFSPWPTIDSAGADEFKAVYARYRPSEEAEDIGLIMWGWLMLVHQVLDDTGPDLSRQSFTRTLLETSFDRPAWNPLSYPTHGARGTDAVAVFRADGQAKRWRQVAGFSTGF